MFIYKNTKIKKLQKPCIFHVKYSSKYSFLNTVNKTVSKTDQKYKGLNTRTFLLAFFQKMFKTVKEFSPK